MSAEKQNEIENIYKLSMGLRWMLNENVNIDAHQIFTMKENSKLIKCSQIVYNGKKALYYRTADCRSLNEVFSEKDCGFFMKAALDLLNTVLDIRSGMKLRCQNIELSEQIMFWNSEKQEIRLVYYPIVVISKISNADFDADLRQFLLNLINNHANIQGSIIDELRKSLENDISLEMLMEKLINSVGNNVIRNVLPLRTGAKLRLASKKMPRIVFEVHGEKYYIGSGSDADGYIPKRLGIEANHCCIMFNNHGYWVKALDKLIKVNNNVIACNESRQLKYGDVVQIGDAEFKVFIN